MQAINGEPVSMHTTRLVAALLRCNIRREDITEKLTQARNGCSKDTASLDHRAPSAQRSHRAVRELGRWMPDQSLGGRCMWS